VERAVFAPKLIEPPFAPQVEKGFSGLLFRRKFRFQ